MLFLIQVKIVAATTRTESYNWHKSSALRYRMIKKLQELKSNIEMGFCCPLMEGRVFPQFIFIWINQLKTGTINSNTSKSFTMRKKFNSFTFYLRYIVESSCWRYFFLYCSHIVNAFKKETSLLRNSPKWNG